jgi:hypothetical protein
MPVLLLYVDDDHPINSRTASLQWILFNNAARVAGDPALPGFCDVIPHGQHRVWVMVEEMQKGNVPVNIRCANPSPNPMLIT